MRAALIAALMLCLPGVAVATRFVLPGLEGDMIGEMRSATVAEGQTLLDIARDNDLGYQEIVRANPELDPWLPPVGAKVVLPTRYILPSATRTGIVVNLAEMRLYYFVPAKNSAGIRVFTYPLGIGQEGWSTPTGPSSITEKIKDPAWTVPESIRAAHNAEGHGELPAVVPPGPDNPLGQYALRLENSRYLIHGTNKPYGVGRRISHGCIRMYPEDIEELFPMVPVGTRVMRSSISRIRWDATATHCISRRTCRSLRTSRCSTTTCHRPWPLLPRLRAPKSARSYVIVQPLSPNNTPGCRRILAKYRGR